MTSTHALVEDPVTWPAVASHSPHTPTPVTRTPIKHIRDHGDVLAPPLPQDQIISDTTEPSTWSCSQMGG